MSYAEKLRDPRWQKKRLEILSRDEFTCLLCQGKKDELHVHHAYYLPDRDPWEYEDSTLWTLCFRCHSFVAKAQAFLLMNDLHPVPAFGPLTVMVALEYRIAQLKIEEEAGTPTDTFQKLVRSNISPPLWAQIESTVRLAKKEDFLGEYGTIMAKCWQENEGELDPQQDAKPSSESGPVEPAPTPDPSDGESSEKSPRA
jgi:hypothetical protein